MSDHTTLSFLCSRPFHATARIQLWCSHILTPRLRGSVLSHHPSYSPSVVYAVVPYPVSLHSDICAITPRSDAFGRPYAERTPTQMNKDTLPRMMPRVSRTPLVAMMQSENVNPVTAPPFARGIGAGGVFEKHLTPLAEDKMTPDEIV